MCAATLTDGDRNELVALLTDLVRIPSVNSENPSTAPEAEISRYVAGYLERLGMHVEQLIMPVDRPHLLASWPTDKTDRLVLTAHMDTVYVDGMTNPFGAEIRDGRIWGRGTCDTKGSLAAYLWTLAKTRQLKDNLPWRVEFLAVCDEETGCTGSKWLVDNGVTADYMIVGEPTQCEIATCHRGKIRIELTAHGKAVHASIAQKGVNAIYHLADVLNVLRRDWLPTVGAQRHDLLGPASANATMIAGGIRDNTIPDRCELVIDARTVPGHDDEGFVETLRSIVEPYARSAGIDLTVKAPSIRGALNTDHKSPLVRSMLDARRSLDLPAEPTALPYLTDAGNFAQAGAQCVVFGPGHVDQAHVLVLDEYLELDQLFLAAEILLKFFRDQAK